MHLFTTWQAVLVPRAERTGLKVVQRLYPPLIRFFGRAWPACRSQWLRYRLHDLSRLLEKRFGVPAGLKSVKLLSGVTLECDLRDNLQAELFYFGRYAEHDLDLVRRHTQQDSVVIDIGAHVGWFSLEVAQMSPEGRIIAFEPAPDSAARLRRHINRNLLTSTIEVWQLALGNRMGVQKLRADPLRPYDTGLRSLSGDGDVVAEVDLTTLDQLAVRGDLQLERVDVVKIDVEGSELDVLKGMRQTLGRLKPKLLLIETIQSHQTRSGHGMQELVSWLEQEDYRGMNSHPGINTPFLRSDS